MHNPLYDRTGGQTVHSPLYDLDLTAFLEITGIGEPCQHLTEESEVKTKQANHFVREPVTIYNDLYETLAKDLFPQDLKGSIPSRGNLSVPYSKSEDALSGGPRYPNHIFLAQVLNALTDYIVTSSHK